MNVTLNTTAFVQELRLINNIIPNKPAIPILSSFLLRTTDRGLSCYATDYELGFSTTCPARVHEAGSMTLPAKRLLDLVEQLPDADVHLVSEGPHVRMVSGAFKSRLQSYRAEDFPTAPTTTTAGVLLSISALQALIKQTRYAISDKVKYMLNGALLTLDASLAALVATDGKRLSIATMAKAHSDASSVILPSKTLDALVSQFSEDLTFAQSDRHLFFVSGDRVLVSRTLDGVFPKYDRIIPRDTTARAVIDRTALTAALKRVGLLADLNQAVYWTFEPNALLIAASSAEAGDAIEHVAISYDGPPLKVCVNWQYVLHFLEVAVGSAITVALKDEKTPLTFTDSTSTFVNIIMLMRP